MTNITLNNNLKNQLGKSCETRYDSICQSVSFNITHLFRTVGMTYSRYCENIGLAAADGTELNVLAEELQRKYGPNFSRENILRMVRFNKLAVTWRELFRLIYYITWEHIVLLLPFDDLAAWLYYIRLTEMDGLSPDELQKAINSRAFEQDETFLGKKNLKRAIKKSLSQDLIDEEFLPLSFMKYRRDWKPFFNVFKEPLASSFKPLIAMPEYLSQGSTTNNEPDILTEISNIIDLTRTSLNQTLNEHFNLFLWDTGRKLMRDIENPQPAPVNDQHGNKDRKIVQTTYMFGTSGQTYEVSKTITQHELEQQQQERNQKFEDMFGSFFNAEQLTLMLEFATIISDSQLTMSICHLATWEQLKELMALNDQERILALAFQIADQNLSPGEVKQLVDNELQNPKKKKKLKLTNNSIYNKKVAVNILNNNLFMQFVEAF